jgi:hypothetical protein
MELEKSIDTPYGPVLFRPYRLSDESAVLASWQTAFGKPMDPEIWRWKFHDNPYGRQMMMALNEAGEPISMYNGVPVAGNWNGQAVKLTQLMDHFSHPDYRRPVEGRKGVFVMLAEHFFDCWGGVNKGTIFPYGFPGRKHFRLGEIFLQYTRVSPIRLFTWKTHQMKRFVWPMQNAWETLAIGGGHFDHIWKHSQSHFPFSIIRDERFIRWRFFEHPIYQYWVAGLKDHSGQYIAYVVGKNEHGTSKIVDLLSIPISDAQWRRAWKSLSSWLYKQGVSQVQLWLPEHHRLARPLLSLGVQAGPDHVGAVAGGRSFDLGLSMEWVAENFYYTMADTDLF